MNMRHRRVLLKGRKRPIVFKHKETLDSNLKEFLNVWIAGVTSMLAEMPVLPKLSKAYRRWEHNVEKAQMRSLTKLDPSYAQEFSKRGHWQQETADIV